MRKIEVHRAEIEKEHSFRLGLPEDVSQWYKVLLEENCKELKRLLDEYPLLLHRGWSPDESVKMSYTPPFELSPRTQYQMWRGRTALHVAVKKGWVDLVTQILAGFQGQRSLSDFLVQQDGYSGLNALAMAVICGNSSMINILADASLQCPNNPYEIERSYSTDAQVAQSSISSYWSDSSSEAAESVVATVTHHPAQTAPQPISLTGVNTYDSPIQAAECPPDVSGYDSHSPAARPPIAVNIFHSPPDAAQFPAGVSMSDSAAPAAQSSPAHAQHHATVNSAHSSAVSFDHSLLDCEPGQAADTSTGTNNGYSAASVILHSNEPGMASDAIPDVLPDSEIHGFSRSNSSGSAMTSAPSFSNFENFESFPASEFIAQTMLEMKVRERDYMMQMYEEDEDFNFLPWQDNMFHLACKRIVPTLPPEERNKKTEHIIFRLVGRVNIVDRTLDKFAHKLISKLNPELVIDLFESRDSQGRTPLHVAVENFTVPQVLKWIPQGNNFKRCLNAVDAAGRTPLYTAAAIRRIWYYQVECLVKDDRTDVNAVFSPPVGDWPFDIDKLSRKSGYKGILKDDLHDQVECSATALHMAIIRGNAYSLASLLGAENLNRMARFRRAVEFDDSLSRYGRRRVTKFWSTPLQLAAMLFPTDSRYQVLECMLKDDRFYDVARLKNLSRPTGNSEAVKMMLSGSQFDCFSTDAYGNTALHFAVDPRGKPIRTHLLDRVNCWWMEYWNLGLLEANLDDEDYVEFQREQTIDHLLQAGMDMWKVNAWGNKPDPGPWASRETRSRWNKRMEIRSLEVQSHLNSAGGAISVTAALVAAASYIGPLQPPLGYDDRSDMMQITHLPVRVFIVCNTLSFYLAISAISLSLIPSLPMRGGAMVSHTRELENTQSAMVVSAFLLFLSICNVVVAFAAASVAVISNAQSWSYGGLTVSTAAIGGFLCVTTMVHCLWRFLKPSPVIFHQPIVRKLFAWYAAAFQRPAMARSHVSLAERALKQETDDIIIEPADPFTLRSAYQFRTKSLQKLDDAMISDQFLQKLDGAMTSDHSFRFIIA